MPLLVTKAPGASHVTSCLFFFFLLHPDWMALTPGDQVHYRSWKGHAVQYACEARGRPQLSASGRAGQGQAKLRGGEARLEPERREGIPN